MRKLLVLLTLSALSCAQAQDAYVGVRLDYVPAFDFFGTQLPLLGFQLGVPVAENLAVRGVVDTVVLVSLFQADLLYALELSGALRAYVGAGPSVSVVDLFRYPAFSLQGTAGLEYRTGGVGLFAEVQPSLVLPEMNPLVKLGAGVNVHF